MMFKRLSCFLIIITCFFITGGGDGDDTVELPDNPSVIPDGMVLIPAGEYQMGSNAPDAQDDERPVHTVYIDAFFMDKYEVTNLEYQKFVLANPHWQRNQIDSKFHNGQYLKHWNGNDYPAGYANHPVTNVSWYAAMAYAQWAGKRLPTEAEWEKAARGGLIGKKYPWGNTIDNSKANYNKTNFGNPRTTPVGKYQPNGYGLYDTSGNVWEWCLDAWDSDFYAASPRRNPISGESIIKIINNSAGVKSPRVYRGGSSRNFSAYVRVAIRLWAAPRYLTYRIGFRCARDVKP